MKVKLKINGKDYGDVEVNDGISGTELAREYNAPPPVTLMKLSGRFVPLPEKLKEGDEVELIITSSSG
jgi:sulfur carrier protein ThiS